MDLLIFPLVEKKPPDLSVRGFFRIRGLIFKEQHMKALLQVISLVVISVVVVINLPCGATLGERKA